MIYVDNFYAPFRGMRMCHLWSENQVELDAFALKINLKPEWKHKDHYDVAEGKRMQAIRYGAKEIDFQEMAKMATDQRKAAAAARKGVPT